MGWNANATKDGLHLETRRTDETSFATELVDSNLADAFARAGDEVQVATGSRGILLDGGLQGFLCADVLELATGEAAYRACIVWGQLSWSGEAVARLHARADWSRVRWLDVMDAYAQRISDIQDFRVDWWSCKLFLRTCAEHGLGIHFSW